MTAWQFGNKWQGNLSALYLNREGKLTVKLCVLTWRANIHHFVLHSFTWSFSLSCIATALGAFGYNCESVLAFTLCSHHSICLWKNNAKTDTIIVKTKIRQELDRKFLASCSSFRIVSPKVRYLLQVICAPFTYSALKASATKMDDTCHQTTQPCDYSGNFVQEQGLTSLGFKYLRSSSERTSIA